MLPGPGRLLAGRCLRQHPARSSPPPLRAGGTQEISRWWSAAEPPDKPSRRALRPGGAREPWNPAAAPRPGDASSWADLPDCWQPRGRAPGGGRARAGAAWRRAVSARCHGARAPPGRTGGLGRWVRWFRCAPPPANLLRASGTTGTRGRERGRDRTKMSKLQRGVYAAETSAWHGKVRAMPTPFIPRRCGGVNAALPSSLRPPHLCDVRLRPRPRRTPSSSPGKTQNTAEMGKNAADAGDDGNHGGTQAPGKFQRLRQTAAADVRRRVSRSRASAFRRVIAAATSSRPKSNFMLRSARPCS